MNREPETSHERHGRKRLQSHKRLRIAVVGPCGAGKSTLVAALRTTQYEVRHVAQEHSYVPAMWQKITQPDILIYLDVNYEMAAVRRPYTVGGPERLEEQHHRLAHARQHCNLYLDTSYLTVKEVQEQVFAFLQAYVGEGVRL